MSRKVYVIFRANKYTDMLCGSFLSKELAQQKLEVLNSAKFDSHFYELREYEEVKEEAHQCSTDNDYRMQRDQIHTIRVYYGDQSHLDFANSLENFLNERGYLTEKQVSGLARMSKGLLKSYESWQHE